MDILNNTATTARTPPRLFPKYPLSVDVRVRPVVDGEGQEYLQNTAAMPAEESIHQRPQQPQQQQQ
jgi:hypothetical protein